MSELEKALQPFGMIVLGQARTNDGIVTLIGNAGSDMWQAFCRTRSDDRMLLDDWTKEVLNPVAERFCLQARYPYDQPYPPILTWAQQAGIGSASPLGLLIHPIYGLWHAYRAAFIGDVDVAMRPLEPSPCLSCADQPCLAACPVGAFSNTGYDVDACRSHISASDTAACMSNACAARRACPIGKAYVYEPEHAQFHMRAFVPSAG